MRCLRCRKRALLKNVSCNLDLCPSDLGNRSCPDCSKYLCTFCFKSLPRFRSYRVHKISMAVATRPWPLSQWPWKCHRVMRAWYWLIVMSFVNITFTHSRGGRYEAWKTDSQTDAHNHGFRYLWSNTPPFCWTPRHAGSSHQNWARPTEFFSCCTDRLELSSGTSALDTDWSQTALRDGLKSHLFADAYFWSSENIRYKSVMYLLTYLLTYSHPDRLTAICLLR